MELNDGKCRDLSKINKVNETKYKKIEMVFLNTLKK